LQYFFVTYYFSVFFVLRRQSGEAYQKNKSRETALSTTLLLVAGDIFFKVLTILFFGNKIIAGNQKEEITDCYDCMFWRKNVENCAGLPLPS
jgi:hypothetical protein